jgi:hypothetical protein
MTAKDLFGVGVRLIGIAAVAAALPAILRLDYYAAAQGVAGLVLITRADLIAGLCYRDDLREKTLRDLKDF